MKTSPVASGAVLNCQTKHDDLIFARANFCRFFSPHLIITSCSCRPARAAGTLSDVMDNITYKIQYFQLYYFCEFACFPMQCTIQNYSIVFINKSHKIGTESYITPRPVGHLN